MGSKSMSKNRSTSTNAAQMAALQRANPAPTFDQVYGNQQKLQGGMLEQVMGAFNAMKQAGDAQMGQNPMQALMSQMFGGQMQQPQQPMFDMSQFQQPEPEPQQQAPQAPWMRGMTPEQLQAIQRFNVYGGRR
jgi:hypothetical protein